MRARWGGPAFRSEVLALVATRISVSDSISIGEGAGEFVERPSWRNVGPQAPRLRGTAGHHALLFVEVELSSKRFFFGRVSVEAARPSGPLSMSGGGVSIGDSSADVTGDGAHKVSQRAIKKKPFAHK